MTVWLSKDTSTYMRTQSCGEHRLQKTVNSLPHDLRSFSSVGHTLTVKKLLYVIVWFTVIVRRLNLYTSTMDSETIVVYNRCYRLDIINEMTRENMADLDTKIRM